MLGAEEGADGGGECGDGGEPSLCGGEVGCGGADGGHLASELVGVLEVGQQGVGLGAEGVGRPRSKPRGYRTALRRGAVVRGAGGGLGGGFGHAYGAVVVGQPRRFKVGM